MSGTAQGGAQRVAEDRADVAAFPLDEAAKMESLSAFTLYGEGLLASRTLNR